MSESQFAEDFLRVYDVSDAVATVAERDSDAACDALLDVDLLKPGREAPIVGVLGALRYLPSWSATCSMGSAPKATQ